MKINFIGEKSLSSFIYKTLKIFFILLCIAIPLTVIGLIFDYKKGDSIFYELTSYGLSLCFIKQPNNQFIAQYSIKWMLYSIPALIISLYINYYLIKLFKNFSNDIIFEEKNFKITKLIGISIILLAVSENLAFYFSALTLNNMTANGVTFHTDLTSLILDARYVGGLIIIITAEIFRRAIILKQEQDLTI